jgi:hypothetical protein
MINPGKFKGVTVPNWLLPQEVSPGAKLLYGRLAALYKTHRPTTLNQEKLAADLAVSSRMIRNYLDELIDKKLVRRERRNRTIGNRYLFLQHPWMNDRFLSDRKNYSDQELRTV